MASRHASWQGSARRRAGEALVAVAILGGTLTGLAVVWFLGLREFAFTDYDAEALPAVNRLLAGDASGFFGSLPGYAGAMVLQAPFAIAGGTLGSDAELWAWRAQAIPGLAIMAALAVVVGRRVASARRDAAGAAWGGVAALLIAGSPFSLLALQTGHAEELLVTGLACAAAVLAARGNLATAGALVGIAAVAKPWALIAVPVILVAATDRRQCARSLVACVVAGAVLSAPMLISNGAERATGLAHASTTGIFKPDNVFWFSGPENPSWKGRTSADSRQLFQRDPTLAPWAQRLESGWAARISHPLIVVFAFVMAGAYWWRRRHAPESRRDDLLLLLATVAWWRCLLDTWNFHYYALAALIALTMWEARRGRLPLAAAGTTVLAWCTFQLEPFSGMSPDAHTAFYLAWALPLGLLLIARLMMPGRFRSYARRLASPLAARLPTLARSVGPRREGPDEPRGHVAAAQGSGGSVVRDEDVLAIVPTSAASSPSFATGWLPGPPVDGSATRPDV